MCIYISFNKQTNPFCLEKGYGISVTLTLGNTHLTQCLLTLLDLINQKVDVALVTLCYTGLLQLIVHTHTLKMVKQYISIIYIFLTKFDSLCVLAVTASVHCHCLLALYLLTHPFPSFASQCSSSCAILCCLLHQWFLHWLSDWFLHWLLSMSFIVICCDELPNVPNLFICMWPQFLYTRFIKK